MKHIDERDLDMFAIDPGLLDPALQSTIQFHLEECGGCKAITETAREMYGAKEKSREVPPEVLNTIVQQIVPAPNIVHLKPQTSRAGFVEQQSPNAVAPDQKSDRFVTIAILESGSGEGSATLQRNPTSNLFRVQFQTGRFLLPRWGIYSMEHAAQVLLDENGRAEFTSGGTDLGRDWVPEKATVRFPAGSVRVGLTQPKVGRSISIRDPRGVFSADFQRVEGGWNMRISTLAVEKIFDLACVIDPRGNADFYTLHEQSCLIMEPKILDEATLIIYRMVPDS